MEWQPIATAPKDGTWLLLYCPCESFPDHEDMTHWIAAWRWGADGLPKWLDQDDAVVVNDWEITHWMPLPKPPAGS